MTDISLAPLVDALSPILVNTAVAVVAAGVPIVGGWIIYLIQKIAKVKLTDSQRATYDSAVAAVKSKAATWASVEVAKDINNLRGQSIKTDNPIVLAAASSIAADLPQVLKDAGWDKDSLAKLVAGEIGKLQPPPLPVAAPVVVAAPVLEPVQPLRITVGQDGR